MTGHGSAVKVGGADSTRSRPPRYCGGSVRPAPRVGRFTEIGCRRSHRVVSTTGSSGLSAIGAVLLAVACIVVPLVGGFLAGALSARLVGLDARSWRPRLVVAGLSAFAVALTREPGLVLLGIAAALTLLSARLRRFLSAPALTGVAAGVVSLACPLSAIAIVAAACGATGPIDSRRSPSSWRGAATIVVPAVAAVALAPSLMQFGIWDMLSFGALAGVGALLGSGRLTPRRGEWAIAATSALVALMIGEVVLRYFTSAPAFPPIGAARLRIGYFESGMANGCEQLFGAIDLPPRLPGIRRMIHVGDSMVEGVFVGKAERFTNVLQQLEPEWQHVNAGVSSTGPDFYLEYLRKHLDIAPADAAAMYILLANDERDLDTPYRCCDDGPLLEYRDGEVFERCPHFPQQSRTEVRLDWLLRHSPPPYPLRVATGFSHTARLIAGLFADTVDRLQRGSVVSSPREHMTLVINAFAKEMIRRNMRGVVVLLYSVSDLTNSIDAAHAIADVATAAGLPVLDAAPVLRANAIGGDPRSLYVDDQLHFNAVGHRVIGRWLHEALPAALTDAHDPRRRGTAGDGLSRAPATGETWTGTAACAK